MGFQMAKKNIRVPSGRDVISIRCKPEIKAALKRFCETNGLSICHVFELLVTGYLTGMQQQIDWVNKSPTIELTVVREVKRIRRYKRERDLDVDLEEFGSPDQCCFTGCTGKVVKRVLDEPQPFHQIGQYVCEEHFLQRKTEIRRGRRPFSYREV